MGIDSGVPTAPPEDTGKWGQAVEIDLAQSINTDTITQDIRQFRPQNPVMQHINGPTLQNTGIVKDGGVTELWETVYASIPNAIAGYVTSNGLGLAVTTPDSGATLTYNKVTFSNGGYSITPIRSTNSNLDIPNNQNVFFQRYSVSGYYDMTPISGGAAPTSALGLKIGKLSITLDEVDVISGKIYNTQTLSTSSAGQALKASIVRVGNIYDGGSTFSNQISTYGFTFQTTTSIWYINISNSHAITSSASSAFGPAYYIPSSGLFFSPASPGGGVYGFYYSSSPLTSWTASTSAIPQTSLARNYGNASNPLIQSHIQSVGTNSGATFNISPTATRTSVGSWSVLTSPVIVSGFEVSQWGSSSSFTATGVANASAVTTWGGSAPYTSAMSGQIDLSVSIGTVPISSINVNLNANTINGRNAFIFFSSAAATISFSQGSAGITGASINEYGDLPGGTISNQNGNLPIIVDDLNICICPNIASGSNRSTILCYKSISGNWIFVDIFNPIPISGQSSSYGSSVMFNEISPGVVMVNDSNGSILDLNSTILYLDIGPMSWSSAIWFAQNGTGYLYALTSSNRYSNSIYTAPFQSSNSSGTGAPQSMFSNNVDLYFGVSSCVYQETYIQLAYINKDDAKTGTTYANQSNVPFVHTAMISGGVVSLLNNAAIQLPGFASYNIANFIGSYTWPQFGGASGNYVSTSLVGFILFGYYYGYDGTNIYSLNLSGGSTGTLVGQPQILVRAQGLKFLCVTPTEAIFLSTFDNSIWSFNGGRTVDKIKAFNQQPAITNGYYDVFESALFLTNSSSYLTQRDGILSKNSYSSAFSGNVPQANPSSQGMFWSYVNSSGNLIFTQRTYSKITGSNPIPLTYQTSYYGPGNGMVIKIQRVAIQVYTSAGLSATLQLTLNYKTTDNAGANATQTITVYPSGTTQTGNLIIQTPGSNGEGYAWFDWSPTSKYGVGSSLTITDATVSPAQKIAILDMIWYYTIDGVEVITGKVTGG